MSAKTGECRAKSKDEDGLECDCTLYEEDTEQSGYCSTCYHREKAHLLSTPGATVPKLHVRSLLAGMMDGTKLGSKLFTSSSSASSSRKKIVPSLSTANRESNQGMRPPKAGSSKGKGKKNETSASTTFKVISIHVLPYGIEEALDVSPLPQFCIIDTDKFKENGEKMLVIAGGNNKTPTSYQIDVAAGRGLAVFDSSKGIELDRAWTHEQLVEALMGLLPFPFAYFEQLEDEAGDGEAAWRLASAVSKKLLVLDNPAPAGKDVDFHKGNVTNGFRNWRVFIVAREPIPAKILRKWGTQLGGASGSSKKKGSKDEDSDSESESDQDSATNSPSPEKIPRTNKRRLVSKGSGDEDEPVPKKKGKGPAGKTWIRGPEGAAGGSKSEPVIDLTADEGKAVTRASSEESVFEDPLIGNPYEKDHIYEFF
ncbi:hypothetical protein B0H16DRAFT_1776739 [Mycena metata]|uniref:Uncharacterized protein n=1 Tax=Mycena metata TaxID=1033252 RepID=A0AAD7JUM5_9AGAR|nr:hypothetical protein B0H16DRAFT_1776739 [Mycena metata]